MGLPASNVRSVKFVLQMGAVAVTLMLLTPQRVSISYRIKSEFSVGPQIFVTAFISDLATCNYLTCPLSLWVSAQGMLGRCMCLSSQQLGALFPRFFLHSFIYLQSFLALQPSLKSLFRQSPFLEGRMGVLPLCFHSGCGCLLITMLLYSNSPFSLSHLQLLQKSVCCTGGTQ